jgi:hypothetical protein
MRNLVQAVFVFTAALVMASCSGDPGPGDGADTLNKDTIDVTGVKVSGQSFMVPSPMQIADLIKKSGAAYNKDILNPTANLSKYSDASKQALNLGVYGADLGYITMYDNSGDAMEYYKTVVQLGDQLKITGSFDKGLMDRFNANIGKKDSILTLVGEAYRRSDNFLRESEQDYLAALILTGGWIESIYFSLNVYKQKPDPAVAIRIGEQKNTVAGLIKVLKGLDKPENAELIRLLEELNVEYQKVQIKYTFAEPIHDDAKKTTTINGKTDVNITPELINSLTEKVNAVRNYIIN